jgi:hypothetical protein
MIELYDASIKVPINKLHDACWSQLPWADAEAAGVRLSGHLEDTPYLCTRERHPEGTLHISHGVYRHLVWGPDGAVFDAEGCEFCGKAFVDGDDILALVELHIFNGGEEEHLNTNKYHSTCLLVTEVGGCTHNKWADTKHCAEMSCPNYIGKHTDFDEYEDRPYEGPADRFFIGYSLKLNPADGSWQVLRGELLHVAHGESAYLNLKAAEGWAYAHSRGEVKADV